MKQVFSKCKLLVKTRVAMMLYLLLVAVTAALKLWAAGTKIRVAYMLCERNAVLLTGVLLVKATDFLYI